LEVADFKLQGSEGSQPFGKPSSLLKRPHIQAALSDLENLCSGPGSPALVASQPTSPARSQVQTQEESSSALQFASQAFATQLPKSMQKAATRNITTGGSERRQSDKGSLLNLLALQTKKGGLSIHQDASHASPAPPNIDDTSPGKPPVLSEASPDKIAAMSSKLDAKANSQPSQASLSSQSASNHSSNKPSPVPLKEVADGAFHATTRYDSEKENSQDSQKRGRESSNFTRAELQTLNSAGEPKQQNGSADLTNPKTAPFFDEFLSGDLFKDLKRVPRKYARIPSAQKDILESKESWFNPSTEPRNSYALMPAEVRDDFIAFLSKKQDPKFGQQSVESASESDGPESSVDSGDESQEEGGDDLESEDEQQGIDLDSEEEDNTIPWSPSPDRHQPKNDSLIINPGSEIDDTEARSATTEHDHDDVLGGAVDSVSANAPPASAPASMNKTHQRQRSPPPKRRFPVVWSSSPAPEEELELDELHAVGDEVEADDVEIEQVPDTSQEIPSTAVQNLRQVQVERTPDVKFHDDRHKARRSHSLGPPPIVTKGDLDSSHLEEVIPATCDNASPKCLTASSSGRPTIFTSVAGSQKNRPSHLSNPENIQTHTPEDGTVDEDILASQQIDLEPQSREPQSSASINSSPIRSTFPVSTMGQSGVEPMKNGSSPLKPQSPICVLHSSPPSGQRPASTGKHEAGHVTNNRVLVSAAQSPKRGNDSVESPSRHFPLKRRRHEPALAAIQREENNQRNTKEMARTARHRFTERLSAGIESPSFTSKAPVTAGLSSLKVSTSSPHPPIPRTQPPVSSGPTAIDPISSTPYAPRPQTQRQVSTFESTNQIENEDHSQPAAPEQGNKIQAAPSDQVAADFYTLFKAAYPEYTACRRDFTWSLVYIEWLEKQGTRLHPSVWDDFIRVVISEYRDYARKLRDSGHSGDIKKGYDFYNDHVPREQIKFDKGLITTLPKLQEAILSLDPKAVERYRHNFDERRTAATPVASSKNHEVPQQPEQARGEASTEAPIQVMESPQRKASSPQRAPAEASAEAPIVVEESPQRQDVASPDLGSLGTRKVVPKRRFFETFSQLPTTNSKATPTVKPSPRATPAKDETPRSRRSLPWQQGPASSPLNPASSSGTKRKRPTTSPSPTARHKSLKTYTLARPTSAREEVLESSPPINRHQNPEDQHGTPSSPILGTAPSPPHPHQNPKSSLQARSSPFSLSALHNVPSSSNPIDGNNKVGNWLAQTPQPKVKKTSRFEQFLEKTLAKRRQSGGLLGSRGSTPGRRFCTKPKERRSLG